MPIDELLTATRDVPEASGETLDRARHIAMREADASVDRILRLSRKRSRRRRVGYATIATAACAAALVVGPRLDGADPSSPIAAPTNASPATHTTPPVESAKFTNAAQVFTAAAQSSSPDPTAGAYWRVDSQYQQRGDPAETRTVWLQRDGRSMLYDTGVDSAHLVSLGKTSFSLEQRSLTWDQLMALPTDTKALLTAIRADTAQLRGGHPDHYAFKTVGELLMESPAPQRLRSALWDAAAKLDGVRLTGRTTDAKGRAGWGITDGTITYVVAPESGSILEVREGPDYRMTYLDRGPTNVAPQVHPTPLNP